MKTKNFIALGVLSGFLLAVGGTTSAAQGDTSPQERKEEFMEERQENREAFEKRIEERRQKIEENREEYRERMTERTSETNERLNEIFMQRFEYFYQRMNRLVDRLREAGADVSGIEMMIGVLEEKAKTVSDAFEAYEEVIGDQDAMESAREDIQAAKDDFKYYYQQTLRPEVKAAIDEVRSASNE